MNGETSHKNQNKHRIFFGKVVVAGILIIFVVFIGLAVFLHLIFDEERIRNILTTRLEEVAGVPVKIGQTSLSVWGRPALIVHDLEIGNSTGFSAPYFMKADSVEASFHMLPLLRKKFEISALNVSEPDISMELIEGKGWNINGIFQSAKSGKSPKLPDGSPGRTADKSLRVDSPVTEDKKAFYHIDILMRSISITHGNLNIQMLKHGETSKFSIPDIQISTSNFNFNDFFDVEGQMSIPSSLNNRINFSGKVTTNLGRWFLGTVPISFHAKTDTIELDTIPETFRQKYISFLAAGTGKIDISIGLLPTGLITIDGNTSVKSATFKATPKQKGIDANIEFHAKKQTGKQVIRLEKCRLDSNACTLSGNGLYDDGSLEFLVDPGEVTLISNNPLSGIVQTLLADLNPPEGTLRFRDLTLRKDQKQNRITGSFDFKDLAFKFRRLLQKKKGSKMSVDLVLGLTGPARQSLDFANSKVSFENSRFTVTETIMKGSTTGIKLIAEKLYWQELATLIPREIVKDLKIEGFQTLKDMQLLWGKNIFQMILDADLTGSSIQYGDLFRKTTGIKMNFYLTEETQNNQMKKVVGNLDLDQLKLQFDGQIPMTAPQSLSLNLSAKTAPIKSIMEVFNTKKYLTGKMQLTGDVNDVRITIAEQPSQFDISGKLDLTPTGFNYDKTINKNPGLPGSLDFKAVFRGDTVELQNLECVLNGNRFNGRGIITNPGDKTKENLSVQSSNAVLQDLAVMVPEMGRRNMKGNARVDVKIKNPGENVLLENVTGEMELINVSFKHESLLKPVQNLQGTMRFQGSSVAMDKATAQIGNTELNGSMQWKPGDNPAITFSLDSNRMDIADFSTSQKTTNATQPIPGAGTKPGQPSQGQLAVPVQKTGQSSPYKIQGMLSARELLYGSTVFTNASIPVSIDKDITTMNPVRLNVGGGSLNGSINFKNVENTAMYEGQITAADIEVNKLFQSKSLLKPTVFGALSGNLKIDSSEYISGDVMKGLIAAGQINVVKGKIESLKIMGLLTSLRTLGFKLGPELDQGTEFDRLESKIDIKDGIIHCNDLVMEAQNMKLTGKGTCIYPSKLDFNLKVVTKNSLKDKMLKHAPELASFVNANGDLEIPCKLTGTLAEPVLLPDKSVLSKFITDQLIDKLHLGTKK